MKCLGIDYGSRTIGLAKTDEGGTFAFPHSEIPNDQNSVEAIRAVVEKESVGIIYVGDTRTHGGAANDVTQRAEAFVEALKRSVNVPVHMVNEAWSSKEAARFAPKGSEHNNAAAAAIILQRALEMRK